jgi:predicted RNA-binding protein with PUA-like domain
MGYWLFKSEPTTFGIDRLKERKSDSWDGVRNYQARNFMRDRMRQGDRGFFYHSNCVTPGIVGVVEIVKAAYPDHTQFDPESDYYDPKATQENPRWFMVDVGFVKKFRRTIRLAELKGHPGLKDMMVIRRGNRLSITPVTAGEWAIVMGLAGE